MRHLLAAVTARKQGLRPGAGRDLFQNYLDRLAGYEPVDTLFVGSEAALFERVQQATRRLPAYLVLLDSRGTTSSSEAFAERLRTLRDGGTQQIVFAIGPADGWSEAARKRAQWLLSLGPMTLPHELALVVLSEQLYRGQSILAGHPYHSGH